MLSVLHASAGSFARLGRLEEGEEDEEERRLDVENAPSFYSSEKVFSDRIIDLEF